MNFHNLRADYLVHQLFFVYLPKLKNNFGGSQNFLIQFFISVFLFLLVIYLIRKILSIKRSLGQKNVLLELTPPAVTEKTAYTTQQIFSVFHDLGKQKSFIDKLLGKKTIFSFEIVSSKSQGIRYLIRTTPDEANNVKRNLLSYLPQVRVKIVDEYLPQNTSREDKFQTKVVEFKLKRHFAYPLRRQDTLEEHDPVAYITGQMTKLSPSELISYQIVLSPAQIKTKTISRMILNNEDVLSYLNKPRFSLLLKLPIIILNLVAKLIKVFLDQIGWAIQELASGGGNTPAYMYQNMQYQMQVKQNIRPARILSSFEQTIVQSIGSKIDQSLFETSIRLLIVVKDKKDLKERIQGFGSSLSIFSVPKYQSLNEKYDFPPLIIDRIRLLNFRKRLLSLINNKSTSLLSVSEVSDLYHFPFTRVTQTENIVKSLSRELPAPLSFKKGITNLDLIVGKNTYGGEETPIGQTLIQRRKHTYIIGKTGTGKTEMIKNMIFQDMQRGKGLAVLDPHGDLTQDLLRIIPENRKDDVIYFDPSDREWPVGLNILSPGIKFSNDEDKEERIASSVIAIFQKLTAEQYWGPRMEHILRNATLTALQMPIPTLWVLQQLLTDKDYQKKVAGRLPDPILKQFWEKEFANVGNMQMFSITAPLTERLGLFITSKMSRHILLQETSTISIQKIMDTGKIFLVNLSKGDLGEDQSFFFGTMITSFIWMAAYQRTKIPESQRRDFFLYVDEFQNFATKRFAEISSESRKFHVSLTSSHQNIAQIEDPNILRIVVGNADTFIAMKAGPDDEKFILPFMEPQVKKGDIVNLPPYKFFMKVTNEDSEDAFSGKTVQLDLKGSDKVRNEIIAYSRKYYATERSVVEKYLEKLFGMEEKTKVKKVKPKNKKTSKNYRKNSGKNRERHYV